MILSSVLASNGRPCTYVSSCTRVQPMREKEKERREGEEDRERKREREMAARARQTVPKRKREREGRTKSLLNVGLSAWDAGCS